MDPGRDWWKRAVFYQIYPRSFMDSDGDGVGDLRGIRSRLPYLARLGVDALWISPFFKSPMKDFGYDVADYRDVDPLFGSLDDCRALVADAHRLGLRVLLDLVANHTSDEHPWFVEARSSRDHPRHGWYLWHPIDRRDAFGRPVPPNNWKSLFELRSAWFENAATDELYLGTFTRHQPELDWRNPAVAEEFADVLRFWFALGVDGFRLDVATAYFKDAELRSNPFSWKPLDLFQRHVYDRNRPEVFGALAGLRKVADEAGERVLVGETHGRDPALAAACHGERGEGLHMAFNFEFLFRPWSARAFRDSARAWYAALPEGAWPNFTLSNHDQLRHARRYRKTGFTDARARVAAAMLLTLRGSPFLYYGEELGMEGSFPRRRELRDPLGIATWPLRAYGRDPERAPMQWDSSPNAGFTEGRPWLPLEPGWRGRNVEAQERDRGSVLNFYKALLALRRSRPELALGDLAFVGEDPDVLAYERRGDGGAAGEGRVLVVLNFASKGRRFELPSDASVLLGTHREAGARIRAGRTELRPCEVLLLEGRD
ncbi:MAG: DUF3459 domain-containing protein [Spirochaetia bacterium]|nr:DUF3459 domain-containing protein [Spirochaetia bacterium]